MQLKANVFDVWTYRHRGAGAPVELCRIADRAEFSTVRQVAAVDELLGDILGMLGLQ